MANFNKFERSFAKFLGRNPALKNLLKRAYQYLSYILNKKNYTYKCEFSVAKINLSENETFFGYYDKSPFKKHTMFHETSGLTKLKPKSSVMDDGKMCCLVIRDTMGNVLFKKETNAYNWQQGSKAQWIGENTFVYNDIVDGEIVAKYIDLNFSVEKTLVNPIYDTFGDIFYLSLNYKPLLNLRPDYAYFGSYEVNSEDFLEQSIIFCDYTKSHQVFNLKQILSKYPLDFECDYYHQKFNHIMISPDGNEFIVLHRAYTKSGQRKDRLLLGRTFGFIDDVRLISSSGMISHCCWKDSHTIIAYMNHQGENGYFIIDLLSDNISKICITGLSEFGDGHPTYIGNDFFISDTYPDKSRMKKLLLVNLKDSSFRILGEFFEPMSYFGETRCDLHPKWSSSEKSIYIDSVHEGSRFLYKVGPIDVK